MDEETIAIQKIFSGLVSGFGLNQAKIYRALLDGEAKTASQLVKETGIHESVIFRELKALIKNELVQTTGSKPLLYFIDQPLRLLDSQIRKQSRLMEKKQLELKNILEAKQHGLKEYLIRLKPDGRTLIRNPKTRQEIKDSAELCVLRKIIEQAIKEKSVENKYLAYQYNK